VEVVGRGRRRGLGFPYMGTEKERHGNCVAGAGVVGRF
jgi:hypothetical protein